MCGMVEPVNNSGLSLPEMRALGIDVRTSFFPGTRKKVEASRARIQASKESIDYTEADSELACLGAEEAERRRLSDAWG